MLYKHHELNASPTQPVRLTHAESSLMCIHSLVKLKNLLTVIMTTDSKLIGLQLELKWFECVLDPRLITYELLTTVVKGKHGTCL